MLTIKNILSSISLAPAPPQQHFSCSCCRTKVAILAQYTYIYNICITC